jgi:signal transduction histidine kinase
MKSSEFSENGSAVGMCFRSCEMTNGGEMDELRQQIAEVEKSENRRRQAEGVLLASESRFREVIEQNADAIVIVDNDGIVRFVNPAAETLFSRKAEDLLGELFGYPVVVDENTEIDIILGGRVSAIAEMRVAKTQWQGATAYLASLRDITVRKQSEDALRKSRDELEQALARLRETQAQMIQSEKMASIGQLAAGVAHEINNPTGFVSSNLKTLSDYEKDVSPLIGQYRGLVEDLKDIIAGDNCCAALSEQVARIATLENQVDMDFILNDMKNLIEESREGTERIKKIVLNLKDFAHPGEDKLQFADINQCLESTLNVVWNELKYKATVTKAYGDLPIIQCYPQQLNQVFMNLLVNAGQAIEKKGEIKISTRADDAHVEVEISDTGSGIPEENLSKIFDPFFTTKEVGKGTGLGLNVSYNIIKKHKGTIDVKSAVGKGTTFTVRLPSESNEPITQ